MPKESHKEVVGWRNVAVPAEPSSQALVPSIRWKASLQKILLAQAREVTMVGSFPAGLSQQEICQGAANFMSCGFPVLIFLNAQLKSLKTAKCVVDMPLSWFLGPVKGWVDEWMV